MQNHNCHQEILKIILIQFSCGAVLIEQQRPQPAPILLWSYTALFYHALSYSTLPYSTYTILPCTPEREQRGLFYYCTLSNFPDTLKGRGDNAGTTVLFCPASVHIEEHCAYWTYAHCTTILPSITTQFEDVLASPAPAPVPPLVSLLMSYVFWMVHITNSFQISMSKVYFWYFWSTSGYFLVLLGISGYLQVIPGTLRYF